MDAKNQQLGTVNVHCVCRENSSVGKRGPEETVLEYSCLKFTVIQLYSGTLLTLATLKLVKQVLEVSIPSYPMSYM